MRIPVIQGLIDRRVLVNFRVDPQILETILPPPFRPQIIRGYGIAGICLIRLTGVRIRSLPEFLGVGSENAAHRIAVEWDVDGQTRCGVYIPRRDTSSRFNSLLGGRLFPGVHHRARFDVQETDDHFHIDMHALHDKEHVLVDAQRTNGLSEASIFEDLSEVSRFFELGSLGYSPQRSGTVCDGLELETKHWKVEPLDVIRVESSFFEDQSVFPPGSATFDNALLMRNIPHFWHSRESLCCD